MRNNVRNNVQQLRDVSDDEDAARGSSFFVGVTTPQNGSAHGTNQSPRQPRGQLTSVGRMSDRVLDYIQDEKPPKARISILPCRLTIYVILTAIFLVGFTGVSYYGVVVQTITEEIGESSIAEERVELYNTISGFIIALVEVLLGLFMHNFLSVYLVYLHNALWFMHSNEAAQKMTNGLRSTMMLVFPILLMLLIGNSLRSLQASQSTVGFQTIMSSEDLFREEPLVKQIIKQQKKVAIEATNATNSGTAAASSASTTNSSSGNSSLVGLGIFFTPVKGSVTPFSIYTKSKCSAGDEAKSVDFSLSVHDLDTANVVVGFKGHEWNEEALDQTLESDENEGYKYYEIVAAEREGTKIEQPNFDIGLAYDLYAHGKIILDKAVADTKTYFYPCTDFIDDQTGKSVEDDDDEDDDEEKSDEAIWEEKRQRSRCRSARQTLLTIGKSRANTSRHTVETLVKVITRGLNKTVDRLRASNTTVTLRTTNLTPQLRMETLQIDLTSRIDAQDNPLFHEDENEKKDPRYYVYANWGAEFCGSDNCVFLDTSRPFNVPKQILMTPFQANCTLTNQTITYSSEVRGYFPTDCVKEESSAVVIGLSSYISASKYGSNVVEYDDVLGDRWGESPYLVMPVRRIRLHVSKLTWKTEDLTKTFKDTACNRAAGPDSCVGLSYRLERSKRLLFASEDALPTENIAAASLQAPIQIMQLNEPRLYVEDWNQTVIPERLNRNPKAGAVTVKKPQWERLNGTDCSVLIDSYIRFINRNQYYLDRPFVQIYRAAFFYLFSNGSVTELSADALKALNTTTSDGKNVSALLEKDALSVVKLKGDVQLRKIRLTVPYNSIRATVGGCAVLVLIALIVLIFPKRRVEYFPFNATKAYEYIEKSKDEKYPSAVYKKTLLFPKTGDTLPMDEFEIEEISLVHRTAIGDEIQF